MSSRNPVNQITSPTLVLERDHIDTDQIIPARFLTTTKRGGLRDHAFADWRGQPPFTDPRATTCRILVTGDNFGCGSSREHAPWALLDYGIEAVISTSFADIFQNNAHKNGILTVQVDATTHAHLLRHPWATVTVDLPGQTVTSPAGAASFTIEPFARHCLMNGIDELDWLLGHEAAITQFEEARP
ncbi:MAG: 3-isopropylmalate dehydratase small subunit [Myxococcota bacterium]